MACTGGVENDPSDSGPVDRSSCSSNNGGCPQSCVDAVNGARCFCKHGFDDVFGDGQTCWSTAGTPDLAAEDDTGLSDSDNLTRQHMDLTFTGSGEPGEEVMLRVEEQVEALATTRVAQDGRWEVSIDFPDAAMGAESSYRIVAQMVAESTTTPSIPVVLVVDRASPNPPTSASGARSFTSFPEFLWVGSESGRFEVELDNDPSTRLMVSEPSYLPNEPLASGEHILTVEQIDLAGNRSDPMSLAIEVIEPRLLEVLDDQSLGEKGRFMYPILYNLEGEPIEDDDQQVRDIPTGGVLAISGSGRKCEVVDGELKAKYGTKCDQEEGYEYYDAEMQSMVGDGEQGVISTTDPLSRVDNTPLVYRLELLKLDPTADLVGEGPEVLATLAVVSGNPNQSGDFRTVEVVEGKYNDSRTPYYSADAAVLTFEGDFSKDDNGVISLSKVSLVLSGKQGIPGSGPNGQVNSGEGVILELALSFTNAPVPEFPLAMELAIDGRKISVGLFDALGNSLLEAADTEHLFDEEWLNNAYVAVGAENVAKRGGAALLDALIVYEEPASSDN